MKHVFYILGCVLIGSVCAETGFSVPQGYTKVTIPSAASSSSPTFTAISVNLFNDLEYSGAAVIANDFDADPDSNPATIGSSQTITAAGAAWSVNEWTVTPHLAHIVNANGDEESFLIVSNTANTLSLDGGFDLLSDLRFSSATSVKIRAAHTMASILGADNTPLTLNDRVFLWDGAWQAFVPFAGDWYYMSGPNSGNTANSAVVFPDEGLSIYTTR